MAIFVRLKWIARQRIDGLFARIKWNQKRCSDAIELFAIEIYSAELSAGYIAELSITQYLPYDQQRTTKYCR